MTGLPVIPPILDQDRYILVNTTSTVTSIDISFPVFGDGEDLLVKVSGAVLDPSLWVFASHSGTALNLLPLPITDGFITFDPALVGTVPAPLTIEIYGSWKPRQVIQPTQPGIARREFNQTISTIIAGMRENQRTGRLSLSFSQSEPDGSGVFDAMGARIANLAAPSAGDDAVRLVDLQNAELGPGAIDINGIIKSDGAGNLSAAGADVDYVSMLGQGYLTPQAFAHLVTGGVLANGQDDYPALQAMMTRSAATGQDWLIPAPVTGNPYLVSATLVCLQPAGRNAAKKPPPLWVINQGATIKATAAMTEVITYGGINSDFSQNLLYGKIVGGVIDCNFLANYGVSCPFFTDLDIIDQMTKNFLLDGWRMGSNSAPAASAGPNHINCRSFRDFHPFTISAITKASPAVVTATAHGFATGTGKTIVIDGGTMTQVNNVFLEINVLDANTFQLLNINSSGYTTFSGTATGYLNMPSMRVPKFLTGLTNATPGVAATAIPHGFTNGEQVFLADVGNMPLADGVFTITVVDSTHFSIGADSTSWGGYSSGLGPGVAVAYVDPDTVETAVYYENATDADDYGCKFIGVRIGFRSASSGGFDGKHVKSHLYNYPEHGEMLTGYDVGGDNAFEDCQFDGPFRFTIQCRSARNRASNCSTNFGGLAPYDLYAAPIRLESGGGLRANLCDWKSASSGARILKDCSGNLAGYHCDNMDYANVYAPVSFRQPYLPAAFVQFTAGSSPVVNNSYNISSVIRNATGDYDINFGNPVPLGAVMMGTCSVSGGGGSYSLMEYEPARTLFLRRVIVYYNGAPGTYGGSALDPTDISLSFMGIYP